MTREVAPQGQMEASVLSSFPGRGGCGCAHCAPPPQGTLIQHLKEHLLHGDMRGSDVLLYYTTVSPAASACGPLGAGLLGLCCGTAGDLALPEVGAWVCGGLRAGVEALLSCWARGQGSGWVRGSV